MWQYYCKDCGGKGICEHGNKKIYCLTCGGSGLCDHGKQKSKCRECVGGYYCEHGENKYYCLTCGGSGLCDHGKRKHSCGECVGGKNCNHGKNKYYCKLCREKGICEHGTDKYGCVKCAGKVICEHGNITCKCFECSVKMICEHGNTKIKCIRCCGNNICEHGKNKYVCNFCDGRRLCKSEWCETHANKRYEGYCVSCFVNNPENRDHYAMKKYKTKETEVVNHIKEQFPDVTWIHDKRVQDGCSRRRPDLLLDMGSHLIIIEIDEYGHKYYDSTCERKRIMEISQDLQHRPIAFIRFNPDEYVNETGDKVSSCWELGRNGTIRIAPKKLKEWEHRIEVLKEQIKHCIDNPIKKTIEIFELFYTTK